MSARMWTAGTVFVLSAVAGPRPPTIAVGLNFTSTTAATSHTKAQAPDANGGVGLDHVVELINGDFRVYDKRTGTRLLELTSDQFWDKALGPVHGPNPDNKDPRLVFDPRAKRWYASAQRPARGDTSVVIARSDGSDPTGGWKGVSFYVDAARAPNTFGDFDQLGYSASAITLSINQFTIRDDGRPVPAGHALYSLKRSDLDKPTPVLTIDRRDHLPDSRTVPPAIDHDGTTRGWTFWGLGNARDAATDLFVRTDLSGDLAAWRLDLRETVVGNQPGALLQKTKGAPLSVAQPGGHPASTQGNQMAPVHLVNGDFWMVQGVVHPEDAKRGAVRWWRIRASDNAILGEGILSDPTLSLLHPSIAVDRAGNVVIGCNATGGAQFLSAYAIAGRVTGSAVVFAPSFTLLKAGAGEHAADSRWGDFTTTVADPSATGTFWTFLVFADADGRWATQITQIKVPKS